MVRYNWPLLRLFQEFWPRGAPGPVAFPWLGDLVSRQKAYYWASQFPEHFIGMDIHDFEAIRAFIARSLTDDDPDMA